MHQFRVQNEIYMVLVQLSEGSHGTKKGQIKEVTSLCNHFPNQKYS